MGGNFSASTNISEQIIRDQINVINTTSQACVTNNYQSENITVSKGSTVINNSTINFNEFATLDVNCLASATNSTAIDSEIAQAAAETAKAVGQNLSGFTFSSADAYNFSRQAIIVGTTVTNKTYQTCLVNAFQGENLTVTSGSTLINNGTINYSETLNTAMNCTLNSIDTNTVKQTLGQSVDQLASSLIENSFALIAVLVFLAIVMFFMFDMKVTESLFNWKTLLVIFGFILLYILIAYWLKIWPFHKSS